MKEIEHDKSYSPFTTHKHLLKPGTKKKADLVRKKPLVVAIQRIAYLPDVYDALVNKRSYKEALPKDKTLGILEKENQEGFSYDPYFKFFIKTVLEKTAIDKFNQTVKKQIFLYKQKNLINSRDAKTKRQLVQFSSAIDRAYKKEMLRQEIKEKEEAEKKGIEKVVLDIKTRFSIIERIEKEIIPAIFVRKFKCNIN